MLRGRIRGTTGVLEGVLREYHMGTKGVLREYHMGTKGVLRGTKRC